VNRKKRVEKIAGEVYLGRGEASHFEREDPLKKEPSPDSPRKKKKERRGGISASLAEERASPMKVGEDNSRKASARRAQVPTHKEKRRKKIAERSRGGLLFRSREEEREGKREEGKNGKKPIRGKKDKSLRGFLLKGGKRATKDQKERKVEEKREKHPVAREVKKGRPSSGKEEERKAENQSPNEKERGSSADDPAFARTCLKVEKS